MQVLKVIEKCNIHACGVGLVALEMSVTTATESVQSMFLNVLNEEGVAAATYQAVTIVTRKMVFLM